MKKLLSIICAMIILVTACKKGDPPLVDNPINFQADKQGFSSDEAFSDIKLSLSRNTDAAVLVKVKLQTSGLTYGTEFTTEPAAVNGSIDLVIPSGSSSATLKVIKAVGVLLSGTESITFEIASASSPIFLGSTRRMQLTFSSIISSGTQLTLEGGTGGSGAVNSVYVDLSANKQTSVLRDSWDLGFASGSEFRVVLNNTLASVLPTTKTDISTVTVADIDPTKLALGFGQGTFNVFDDVNGDLSKTAIAGISANDADNKVYIVNRAGGSGTVLPTADLIKIRILRSSTTGYILQYAKLNETTFKTLTVTKDARYNFRYISFAKGAVEVEPAKANWDIQWGYSIYYTGAIPYAFSDLVFSNHLAGTQVAEVRTSTISYDAYAESNIATTTFSASRNTISSNWRVTSGGTVGVKTDRFYVIQDSAGNVYKLKFISFGPDGGTRGYPVLSYALVKKA
jgi:hypothetical protein